MTDLLSIAVIADTMQFREIRAWLQEANDELRASPDDKVMKALAATCAYLIRDDEMVARAYGQYIAWRSGTRRCSRRSTLISGTTTQPSCSSASGRMRSLADRAAVRYAIRAGRMANENVDSDSDYHGRPYRRRRPTLEEIKQQPLPPEQWDLMVRLPDGSLAVAARAGWYVFDEEQERPDFDRPISSPLKP